MLKKIVTELTNVENEAIKIMEDAQKEAQKMIEEEKNNQEQIKESVISDFNKKGQDMVKKRVDEAHKKAKEIYCATKEEKGEIVKNIKDKFDQAVEMVLDQIVK
ncbi:MAG: hypothetical protein RBS20_00535 [Atribacterota bacterium]|jgi:vacuolar-type H+-ATPase subunit H|nr:hypothetical protein [Atribacterota bacterium]